MKKETFVGQWMSYGIAGIQTQAWLGFWSPDLPTTPLSKRWLVLLPLISAVMYTIPTKMILKAREVLTPEREGEENNICREPGNPLLPSFPGIHSHFCLDGHVLTFSFCPPKCLTQSWAQSKHLIHICWCESKAWGISYRLSNFDSIIPK